MWASGSTGYEKQEDFNQNISVYIETEKNTRDRKTTQQETKYRVKHEIKYLHKNKQHVKQLLYQLHLQEVE